MNPSGRDLRAVVRAIDALTTQVRRIVDALTTTADDDLTTPATTCSARYTGVLGAGECIRAAGHIPVTDHTDDLGNSWGDSLAEYPVFDGPVREAPATDEDALRTARRASLRNLLDRIDRRLAGPTPPEESALLRQHVEAEIREADQWRAGRNTMKRRGEEIERDRDRIAAELEKLRAVLEYEHKRANSAIDRETTAEQDAEEQRRRAHILETELRVLRAGLRANGADPTQIQNLWAQIRLRNRQWRDAKRERDEAQAAIERVRAAATVWSSTALPRSEAHQVLADVRAALDGPAEKSEAVTEELEG